MAVSGSAGTVAGTASQARTVADVPVPSGPRGGQAQTPHPGQGREDGSGHDPASLDRLQGILRALSPVVVAFSGGADSAFLARVASTTLGADATLCVTAVSPSLAPEELADCRALAREWGLRYKEVETHELDRPDYVANGADRCFHCKSSLMDAVEAIEGIDAFEAIGPLGRGGGLGDLAIEAGTAAAGSGAGEGTWTVVLGVNVDDLGDHRPGQQAAAERGARFPLVEAGFTKEDVRLWSQRLDLRTWDKPAAACLASRVPYGTPVTLGTLGTVTTAESALRSLGLGAVRVRHYGDTARIEVPLDDLAAVVARRDEITARLHAAGYRYVTLDLDGLRSGNLNQALERRGVAP